MEENCCQDCCVACTCLYPLGVCQDARALSKGVGVPLSGEGYWGSIRYTGNKVENNMNVPIMQQTMYQPQQYQQQYNANPNQLYPIPQQAVYQQTYAPPTPPQQQVLH